MEKELGYRCNGSRPRHTLLVSSLCLKPDISRRLAFADTIALHWGVKFPSKFDAKYTVLDECKLPYSTWLLPSPLGPGSLLWLWLLL